MRLLAFAAPTALCAALLPAPGLTAQGTNAAVVAYPNDATSSAWGNCFLIGANGGACDDSRAQVLVPARFLPDGGTVVAAEFITFNSSTITYAQLDITLSNVAPRARLDPQMQNNLPAPTIVYSASNTSITWPSNVWTRVAFQAPFTHQGGQDLVLDVAKVVASSSANTFHYTTLQEREDLPRSQSINSSTGTSANNVVNNWRLRLVFSDRATVTLGSDLPGTTGGRHYQLGQPATISAYGFAGQPVVLALDISSRIAPQPLQVPGIGGTAYLDLATTAFLPQVNLGANGEYQVTVTIPNDPALAFLRVGLQGVEVDPSRGVSFTNYVDGFFQP